MFDDWEDYADAIDDKIDTDIKHIQNEAQEKQIAERKMVEDADHKLAEMLFTDEDDDKYNTNNVMNNASHIPSHKKLKIDVSLANNKEQNANIKINNSLHKPKPCYQQKNEQRLKQMSVKLKQQTRQKQKFAEIYGEADEDNEYSNYENKFYN